jgi:hypothetical protein
MALTILDDTMSSDVTASTAHAVPGEKGAWAVSWLPDRSVNRNAAITAMVLAEVMTDSGDMHRGHRLWAHVEGWAAELGLTAPDVIARTQQPSVAKDGEHDVGRDDPEAGG